MPISVACPRCGSVLRAPDKAAGRTAPCPRCKTRIAVRAAPRTGGGIDLGVPANRPAPWCDEAGQEPVVPIRGTIGYLRQTVAVVRFRLWCRSTADLLRLGPGTGARLCGALILSMLVCAAVLVVAFLGRAGGTTVVLLAGGVLAATYLPAVVGILGPPDEELNHLRLRLAAGLTEARAARHRQQEQQAYARERRAESRGEGTGVPQAVMGLVAVLVFAAFFLFLVFAAGGRAGAEAITTALVVLIPVLLYFLPTAVAGLRGHRNGVAIFVLNLFLGWTFVGWVVALVWAVTITGKDER